MPPTGASVGGVGEDASLSELYRGARARITALVMAHPDATNTPVPATPGWRVHDVIAHLVGGTEDLIGGWRPTGGPTEEWTAAHVARGREVPTAQLLDRWAQLSPAIEQLLDAESAWQVVLDVGAHEHDLRAALGDTSARDSDLVTFGAARLLQALRVPLPLAVTTEHRDVRVGPDAADGQQPVTTLTTTTFEAFRWRLGRRSRRQLAAMRWSADPTPYLDRLCVFGPAESDVIE